MNQQRTINYSVGGTHRPARTNGIVISFVTADKMAWFAGVGTGPARQRRDAARELVRADAAVRAHGLLVQRKRVGHRRQLCVAANEVDGDGLKRRAAFPAGS